MNSYERFRAFAAREPMDRPLRYARFTPDLTERLAQDIGTEDFEAHFDMDVAGRVLPDAPPHCDEPDYSVYYRDMDAEKIDHIDSIGVARIRGSMYHFTEGVSPLRNAMKLSELEEYPLNDYDGWDESPMAGEVEEMHRQGRFASVYVGHMYESAWQIRGYEPFLMDMVTRPEWCELLLDRITLGSLNLARAGARAGVDILYCGDDVANQNALMFSPETWRRLMKPRWAKVWSVAREIKPDIQILYHSDGNIEAIIDELHEIGMTILNPLQPECLSLQRVADRYKGRLLFDGSMGTQSVFPFGTPDDVRACVKERIATFGPYLILAPTHILEPEVPIENVKAFFKACDEISFGNQE